MTYVLIIILGSQGVSMQEFNSKTTCEQAIEAVRDRHFGFMECVPK